MISHAEVGGEPLDAAEITFAPGKVRFQGPGNLLSFSLHFERVIEAFELMSEQGLNAERIVQCGILLVWKYNF
ncbi:hypothetical protein BTJ40_00685 [Microbulbifer sp. A4B17]|uniref:hypothetical protein n=1 Tax=Microbulbifer sp. A4B17 TaxID=359370 RepID=UPI000D52B758|nr:hypothetical protein [Microbulbifer sp. A4B17]AWF79460.1 hypothetical protein BTJ40_00685 [Microbulbifer sp. A4B17]